MIDLSPDPKEDGLARNAGLARRVPMVDRSPANLAFGPGLLERPTHHHRRDGTMGQSADPGLLESGGIVTGP